MSAELEAFHKRIHETATQHMDKVWETFSGTPNALRRRVREVWKRHSTYAAGVVNDCLVENYSWCGGFEFDEATQSAFLVTSTIRPFETFVKGLYDEHS